MLGSPRPFPAGRSSASFAVSSSRLSSSLPWRGAMGCRICPLSSLTPTIPLSPPQTYREAPLVALLHRAGPPPPGPSLPEKGEAGGDLRPPPGPGVLGGPLRCWGAGLGVLGWTGQPGELQLQDTCRGGWKATLSPMGAPCHPSHLWVVHVTCGCPGVVPIAVGMWGREKGGLTQKIISRKLVVVPHLEDEFGGHLQHRLVQAPEMLLPWRGGGQGGVMLVPYVPPYPTLGCPLPSGAGRRAARPPDTRRRR